MPYDAFTIDTNTIIHGGMGFDTGLLGQLEQFKGSPVKFVISEIVVRETLKHLHAQAKKTRDTALSSLSKAAGAGLIDEGAATAAKGALLDSRDVAVGKIAAFLKATGAEIVPAKLTTVDSLLRAYFEPTAPFEATGDKKNEFPDAIALMSLDLWARSSGRTIIAASADKGWKAFADKSCHLFVENDLGSALQVVQDDTDAAAAAINGILRRMSAGELGGLFASISDSLSDALIDWYYDIEASSYLRYEIETYELKLKEFSFIEQGDGFDVTIVRLGAEETAIQVGVEIIATASADFSLYAWDSVDREEISLGTTSASTEAIFPASILITFLGPLASSPEELDIDNVELVEGLDSVNMGEIEMDYGRDEHDDYDQLQLAFVSADA